MTSLSTAQMRDAEPAPVQPAPMNGAEALVHTLIAGGVDTCFANPGTSEMHFVAALDRVEGMRCVLCLFEGVATGAADGYARMTDRPAATLLHCGPGLANGLANMHNAKRARTPMVNIVGDHATGHRVHDAPLAADVEAVAWPFSHWVRSADASGSVAADGADAIVAARTPPGLIATLILPADTAWNGAAGGPAAVPAPPPRERVGHERIAEVARLLRSGEPNGVLLAGGALRGPALALAGRISATTGARLMAQTSNARMERGAGRVAVPRVPYNVDPALAFLSGLKHLVLVGAKAPVAFFAYPDKPGVLTPPDCAIEVLARPEHDLLLALEDLTEELGASEGAVAVQERRVPALAEGSITLERLAASVAALLPDDAIVVDEAVSAGHVLYAGLTAAAPHDWLQLTGGSIGEGLPLALGAAIACQQRKVVCLQADGSAMYTVQALWTMARERLDVTTVILNNRAYEILKGELANVGARNAGRKALDMMSLDRPEIDWAGLARSMGVEGHRADTMEAFNRLFAGAVAGKGPVLIDARL